MKPMNPPICPEAMKLRLLRWYTPTGGIPHPEIQERWRQALEAHLFSCDTCKERHAWFTAQASQAVHPDLTPAEMETA